VASYSLQILTFFLKSCPSKFIQLTCEKVASLQLSSIQILIFESPFEELSQPIDSVCNVWPVSNYLNLKFLNPF